MNKYDALACVMSMYAQCILHWPAVAWPDHTIINCDRTHKVHPLNWQNLISTLSTNSINALISL